MRVGVDDEVDAVEIWMHGFVADSSISQSLLESERGRRRGVR